MMGRLFAIWLVVGCGRLDFATMSPDAAVAEPDSPIVDTPALHWTLVQTGAAAQTPVTIAPSEIGDLIAVAVQVAAAGTITAITDDVSNSYIAIADARASDAADGLEIWYVPSSVGRTTTISIAATTSVVAAVAWDVAGLDAANALDVATHVDDQPASATPVGPTITTTAAGDFVVSVAIVANGITATHAGNSFTNDHRTKGNGWAHLTDAAAPAGAYQAEWDQPTAGLYCADAAAFRVRH